MNHNLTLRLLPILICLGAVTTIFGQQAVTRKVVKSGDGDEQHTQIMSADDVFFIGGVGAIISAGTDNLRVDMMPDANNRDPKYRDVDLREGDVIMMVNGKRTKTIKKIREVFDNAEVGDEIMLAIQRGKERIMVSFEKPDNSAGGGGQVMIMRQEVTEGEGGDPGGAVVKTMTIGGPDGSEASVFPIMGFGILLTDSDDQLKVMPKMKIPGMKSQPVDLEEDDNILSINDKKVSSIADFGPIYDDLKPGDKINLVVMRSDKKIKVTFAKPESGGPNVQIRKKTK